MVATIYRAVAGCKLSLITCGNYPSEGSLTVDNGSLKRCGVVFKLCCESEAAIGKMDMFQLF